MGRLFSTVHIDWCAVDRKRLKPGLSLNELASKARITARTLQRSRAGTPVRIGTVRRIANILGVEDCNLLIRQTTSSPDGRPDASRSEELPATFVTLRIPIPFENVVGVEPARMMDFLSEITSVSGPLQVVGMYPGSILLFLNFQDVSSVYKLLLCIFNCELRGLFFDAIHVSPEVDVLAVLSPYKHTKEFACDTLLMRDVPVSFAPDASVTFVVERLEPSPSLSGCWQIRMWFSPLRGPDDYNWAWSHTKSPSQVSERVRKRSKKRR
jgi:transcriptional regulator with XRE-family HTH domain